MRVFTRFLCVSFIALLALPAAGATFSVPPDQELVRRASAIVTGTVVATESREANGVIETVATIEVAERLKGDVSDVIEVVEPGGRVGDRFALVTAATTYEVGERVLLFLGKRSDGAWGTWGMAIGKFAFEKRGDVDVLERTPAVDMATYDASGNPAPDTARTTAFLDFVRDTVAGRDTEVAYAIPLRHESHGEREVDGHAYPGSAYTMKFAGDAYPVRWHSDLTVRYRPNQTAAAGFPDAQTRLNNAIAAWDAPAIYIGMSNGGTFPSSGGEDGYNSVQFDYSGTIPGGESVLAYTWILGTGALETFGGETYRNITETDILMGSGLGSALFTEALTHELGHSIGFRHSNVATPAASAAIMNSAIYGNYGTNLQGWDLDAVMTVYGNGPVCRPVQITSITPSFSSPYGQPASAQVTASGSSPFTYQWFEQSATGAWQPIAGATSSTYTTPNLFSTTTLKARVFNSCTPNGVDSASVTITPVCTEITIQKQPASVTIASGASATLSVEAVGNAPMNYTWYRGARGTTTSPVGTNSAMLNTGALTVTTKFWVRISNPCGVVDSAEATVTVSGGTCSGAAITTQPQNVSVKRGTTFTLSVGATGTAPLAYQWYEGTVNTDETKPVANATAATFSGSASVDRSYWVKVTNSCGVARSTVAKLTVTCAPPDPFTLSVAPLAQSGRNYPVSWTSAVGAKSYELAEVESATVLTTPPNFTGKFVAVPLTPTTKNFMHTNTGTTAKYYYYQMRAICDASNTRLSEIVFTGVLPAPPPNQIDLSQPFGQGVGVGLPYGSTDTFTWQFKLMPPAGAGKGAADVGALNSTFTITSGSPSVTVSPSSGTVPPTGTNVNVTVNPVGLPPGSSGTNVAVSTTTGGTTTTTNVPVTVNLVSPVTTSPKTPPPANAMIIPIVGHAQGALGSQFQSDIRITNTAAGTIKYLLTYTPSRTDGTKVGKQTQFDMGGGKTIALDDVVKNWFSIGLSGESGIGVLEIRPLNFSGKTDDATVGQYATVVASRTYNVTPQGTFGQFIPGIPFADFIAKTTDPAKPVAISLQQIAQSKSYRTNVGIVEGSGAPATVEGRIFNGAGAQVGSTFVRQLGPAEHQQFSLSEVFTGELPDGRVEFRVTSDTGRVIGYASVLDNVTNDPLLVFPVQANLVKAKKWVVPGIADFNNGVANWRSDVRIYNASAGPVTANVTFYQQGPTPAAVTKAVTIAKGEVKALDSVLRTFFNKPNVGGAIHVTTANDTSLVVTARTYDQRPSGTYGQFIPGITPAESTGLNGKPLNLSQIEESARFRSHLGLAETGGGPVTVEISGYVPESTVVAKRQVTLTANEFTQQLNIMKLLNLPDTTNGRVQVKVIGGTGRVTAYVSAIDNRTQDPTYVPAQ